MAALCAAIFELFAKKPEGGASKRPPPARVKPFNGMFKQQRELLVGQHLHGGAEVVHRLGLHHAPALDAHPVAGRVRRQLGTLEVEHARTHLTADNPPLPVADPAAVVVQCRSAGPSGGGRLL